MSVQSNARVTSNSGQSHVVFLLNNKTRRRYDTKHTNTQWYKTFPQYCTYASTGWPKLCDTTLHFCL